MGKVDSALGAIEIGATALWTGASAGFAFVNAPLAFKLVSDRDVFAELTRRTLERLASLTFVSGGVAIGAALVRAAISPDARGNDILRAAAGSAALGAIAFHQNSIVPAMKDAQDAMGGSFHGVAEDDPARIAYGDLHAVSTRVYGSALVLGVAEMMLAATRPT
jgi:hypothetical protein